MKRLLLALSIGSVLFIGCNKQYTCVCTSNEPNAAVGQTKSNINSSSKSKAEKDCSKGNKNLGSFSINCVLE